MLVYEYLAYVPIGSGGGTHSLAGEGVVGCPNSDEEQTLWYSRYICILCS
jgi:hypothetical protein